MCLNGTKSRVRVGKQVSDIFEIHNGLKQGDSLSPLLFNFVLEHAIKSLEDKEGVQLNGILKLLVYADDIVLLDDSEEILKDNMHILRSNTRELGLEVNTRRRPPWINDYDGQMMSGDRLGLKFPDICLMGEEKPQKNLTQETCPDRGSNPGPLRERRIHYPLLHNGGSDLIINVFIYSQVLQCLRYLPVGLPN
ncbi:hypothetical protein C0J52_28015 [Blattella germanica]|nr:hypothetical protein C0J52_28015 [Blattella germanica]